MIIQPYIMRGPDFDGCEGYCDHEKTMAQKGIHWQTNDGKEWGLSVAVAINTINDAWIDLSLWHKYEEWCATQIET